MRKNTLSIRCCWFTKYYQYSENILWRDFLKFWSRLFLLFSNIWETCFLCISCIVMSIKMHHIVLPSMKDKLKMLSFWMELLCWNRKIKPNRQSHTIRVRLSKSTSTVSEQTRGASATSTHYTPRHHHSTSDKHHNTIQTFQTSFTKRMLSFAPKS